MKTATPETIDLDTLNLAIGAHQDRSNGLCALEAVAWLAGEKHSDHPACTCPVIAAFVRRWNDRLNDADRNRLLKPLIPKLVGTRSTREVERKRGWMATDWSARVSTPMWLEACDLGEHATTLRALAELTDAETARASRPVLQAAREAAWQKRAAAYAAYAAADAAYAAYAAAAAAAAAYAAAADAAAADARFKSTLEKQQASAIDLLERMIAIPHPRSWVRSSPLAAAP